MLWLIYSDLVGSRKVILGYLGVIIIFNIFSSNIWGLFPLAMLVIKGVSVGGLKDDYSNSSMMYSFFPNKRSFYVIEKHVLAIVLLVIGLSVWFLTSTVSILNIFNPKILATEEIFYLCIFVIIIMLLNEVHLYFFLKYGSLKAKNVMQPYLIANAVIIIVLVQLANKNLEMEIINIFTENQIILTLLMAFLTAVSFSIGLYLAKREYDKRDL